MATAFQNRIQQWRMRFRGSPVGQFLNWWVTELRRMLPAELRARLRHARRRVLLRFGQHDLQVSVQEGAEILVLDQFSIEQDPRLQGAQIGDLMKGRELSEAPRDLLLDDSVVLSKEVIMPIAAEANLRQALAFEMDRNTPFKADDVYFDYRLVSRERDSNRLRLEIQVAPRAPVDEQVAQLKRRGLAPTGVDVLRDGSPAGVNLLPIEMRERVINRQTRFNLTLGAVVGVLLVVVMAQSLYLRERQLQAIEQRMDEVRQEAMQVQRIDSQIDEATESAGFLLRRRIESSTAVDVLAEVTRVIPDDTYLDRLMVGQGRVQMQGKSENAQQLIELVNQSDTFTEAAFRGPTRLDSRTRKEIFDLNADITVGGAP